MDNVEKPGKSPPKKQFKGGLNRLSASVYQGHSWVHWSMTLQGRGTGWLSPVMHSKVRESLLHALSRHDLVCVVYCLMPDHAHFLLGGLHPGPQSDQRKAMTLFRREWNRQLAMLNGGFRLQKQAHDHALRKSEYSGRDAFQTTVGYILENPVRAGFVDHFSKWEFSGSMIPGYPDLDPRDEKFEGRFWKIYYKLIVDE